MVIAEGSQSQFELVGRVGALSDLHHGSEDQRFPTNYELAGIFEEACLSGVDILVNGGDSADRGRRGQAKELGEIAVAHFPRRIIAVGGNHDSEEALNELRDTGIVVLNRESRVINLNDIRIGIYGQDGSLDHAFRESIRHLPWTEQTPIHQEYTQREYHPHAVRELEALVREGVDALVVISHVPLFPSQISDSQEYPLLEMTPETGEFIERLPVGLKIVLSGHTHSFDNREWGRDCPVAVTENGTIVANVAYPNARRTGRPAVTTFDIVRLHNGTLRASYPTYNPIEGAVS